MLIWWTKHRIVCPLADQYDAFVDWEFFSMCTDLIRCAGRGHLTGDVLWKNFEIWMGQLKVKVKHAPVTHKMLSNMSNTVCRFGLVCVLLSVCSWKCYILLNILRVTVAWIIVTFYCLHQISKFFHKTSPVRCALRAHLIKSVHINFYFQAAKSRKLRVLIPV